MKQLLLLLFTTLCSGALGAATNPTGLWAGKFEYPNNTEPEVSFSVAIKSNAVDANGISGMATGHFIEINTFGDQSSPTLGGNITVRIYDDNMVEMVKTYDGKGGIRHSVWYSGIYDQATDSIKGTWYIHDKMSAKFTMKRISGR